MCPKSEIASEERRKKLGGNVILGFAGHKLVAVGCKRRMLSKVTAAHSFLVNRTQVVVQLDRAVSGMQHFHAMD